MMVSDEFVEVSAEEMTADNVLAASETVLGNGVVDNLRDVVYVKPETFEARHTPALGSLPAGANRAVFGRTAQRQ